MQVAPHVGAWIEIPAERELIIGEMESLPMWERGLKCSPVQIYPPGTRSLPMWERGLKYPPFFVFSACLMVAPHVGAWIEIALL